MVRIDTRTRSDLLPEVDQFLESVMASVHASLPYNHHPVEVEDTPRTNLRRVQSPAMDDHSPPPSLSTIEQCKRLLVPVVLASIQARDPGERIDQEQCLDFLSDDRCAYLIQKASEMRYQLSSLLSQETPVYQSWNGSLKRDRVHEVDAQWVRNTRTRFDAVVSNTSRKDSDITLVDATGMGGKSPPKAPRAMLQYAGSAHDGAPYYQSTVTASPTTVDPTASLIELVSQAIQLFPALKPMGQAMAETDTTQTQPIVPPTQMISPDQTIPSLSTDFVSHLPTRAGTWFRQQGGHFAEIVDVDIEVSDDMFYLSSDRQPSRVRMPLRLCSVPMMSMGHDGTPAVADAVDDAIAQQTFQWPQKGKLVVQVNPGSERHKTWLPHTLESDPLDVTACLRPGKNLFRFIQLSDLSEFTFVLVASPAPPEEAWRGWDWASFADSHKRSTDDPACLSEFAQIRITVRA